MKKLFEINKEKNSAKVELDMSIYGKDAILGASYVFIDRAYIFLEKKEGLPQQKRGYKDKILVNFKLKSNIDVNLEDILGEFFNELVNCALRSTISKQNAKFRKHIVEQALFSAVYGQQKDIESNILDSEDLDVDNVNYEDDPLGIAVPWEDKSL